jgi:hypothetical protein
VFGRTLIVMSHPSGSALPVHPEDSAPLPGRPPSVPPSPNSYRSGRL